VRRAIEYIHAGDVFQVNIAQRLLYPAHEDALSLTCGCDGAIPRRLPATSTWAVRKSPAPRPSVFLKVADREVEARPIKGTRQRTTWAEADLYAGDELLENEKDRAENVMIAICCATISPASVGPTACG